MPQPTKKKGAGLPSVGSPEERRKYLGGSDAAACLGLSPWNSPYRLWCEKTGAEAAPDLSKIDYIYFGNLLEPIVARVFSERVALKVRVEPKLYTHRKYPFLAGHIDRRVLGERAFLECKTANAFDYRDWGKSEEGAAGVPEHYLAQVDHYMHVLDCTHCYVAALIGGNDFRWYRVERDPKREKKLLDAELSFWDLVQKNEPPPVTNEADSRHRWRKLVEGSAVAVGSEERRKLVKLSRVESQLSELNSARKELRNWLFPLFQDREIISHNGEPLARLTAYSRSYFDLDAFRKKQPKTAAKYQVSVPSKKLKILI